MLTNLRSYELLNLAASQLPSFLASRPSSLRNPHHATRNPIGASQRLYPFAFIL